MCGRYTLATPAELIREHFDLPELPAVASRYNIAPSQESLIIAARKDGSRAAGPARWGLTPQASDWTPKRALINARVETISQKPMFRDSFARRRCLVPADGFYEWGRDAQGKTPHFFSLRNGEPFAFAGVWNHSPADGDPVTFAILTTAPNSVVQPVHVRMPVVLNRESYDLWLARRELSQSETALLATPFAESEMRSWKVSPLVNSPANDTAACIAPIGAC